MKTINISISLIVLLFFGLVLVTFNSRAAPEVCSDALLPTVEWVGDEEGVSYPLPDWADTFLVKKRNKLHLTQVVTDTYTTEYKDRVWACSGECLFQPVYQEAFDLGILQAQDQVELLSLDDDVDNRINWFAESDPLTAIYTITQQSQAELITLAVPYSGTWYFYANDSIFVRAKCGSQTPAPTTTSNPIIVPTSTPVPTPSFNNVIWLPVVKMDCSYIDHQYQCGN